MTWAAIWEAVRSLIGGLSDVGRWKLSVDGKRAGPSTGVKVAQEGIRFDFEADGQALTLEATPGAVDHAVVKVNGIVDPDARLVFSMRHQLLKPLVLVFEFKGVTHGGVTRRYRLDNPK
jgi:hypothetical protein